MSEIKNEIYDIHCHFLPGMDDGCKTCEESAKLLSTSVQQGVAGIAATPHYYSEESIHDFLIRRRERAQALVSYAKDNRFPAPRLCLGAEVAYRRGISRDPNLRKLCYGRSNYLLLEMPFRRWRDEDLTGVSEIINTQGLIPVIAHLERFLKLAGSSNIQELLNMNVIIQMNGEFLLDRHTRGKARKMVSNGIIQAMGSDSHNNEKRPPNLGPAIKLLRELDHNEECEQILAQNREIFFAAIK